MSSDSSNGGRRIRVLLVDDSKLYRAHIRRILEATPDIDIVGEASNGQEAVALTRRLRPDFLLLDVIMPVMDGITAIRKILSEKAVPILVLTSAQSTRDDFRVFDALEAGALDVVSKPRAGDDEAFANLAEDLPEKIRKLCRIRVLTRAPGRPEPAEAGENPLYVIGASTGGPQALNTVFRLLPATFPGSILVVQHISHGFLEGLVQWLGRDCELDIQIAQHRQRIEPGHIYFAPTQQHLALKGNHMVLNDDAPRNGCKPAADVLFSSAAIHAPAPTGVILTGMGNDGLEGSRELLRRGFRVLVQSPETCAAAGMPSAVIDGGQASEVLELEAIGMELVRLSGLAIQPAD